LIHDRAWLAAFVKQLPVFARRTAAHRSPVGCFCRRLAVVARAPDRLVRGLSVSCSTAGCI